MTHRNECMHCYSFALYATYLSVLFSDNVVFKKREFQNEINMPYGYLAR